MVEKIKMTFEIIPMSFNNHNWQVRDMHGRRLQNGREGSYEAARQKAIKWIEDNGGHAGDWE